MASKEKAAAKPEVGATGDNQVATREKWRILIFMATETENLIEPAKADLLELLTVKGTKRLSIRVQVHGLQVEPPVSQGSRRYRIAGRRLRRESFLGTGGPGGKALEDFVCDGVKGLHDDTRLVVVLWGHGQGVGEGIQAGSPDPGGLRFAPLAYAGASNQEVAQSLTRALQGRMIDLLVFDSCFMAAVEVVAEFQCVAEYLVASQSTVALPGLQLAAVVRAARRSNHPAMLGREIAGQATLADSEIEALSLFRPPKAAIPPDGPGKVQIEELYGPFKELSEQLEKAILDPAVAGLVFESFHDARFRDVRQFLDLANLARRLGRLPADKLADAARRVREALHPSPDGFLVHVVDKTRKPRYGGVSVYCPWFRASRVELLAGRGDSNVRDADYLALRLVRKSEWGHLMLALAPAWALARADGVGDCERESPCSCCGSQPTPGQTPSRAVRTGGPKEPNLGQSDIDD